MKRSKSILAVGSAVIAVAMSLTACGSAEDDGDTGTTSNGETGSSDGASIAFVQGVAGDEFYISMECGIRAAAEEAGASVDTQGPAKFDPTLQKPIVDSVVASKPDALLVAPTDVTAMEAPLKAAADAGIKVVLVDTTVEDPSFAVSEISSDNVGGGKAAFDAIKQLNPDGGKVLVISTDPGVSTVDARVAGFEEAVKADSTFEYLGVQYSRNEPSRRGTDRDRRAAEGQRHHRRLRDQPVLGGGDRDRRAPGQQAGPGLDRRLRRGPGPGRAAQGGHGPGTHRPAAGHHR